MARAKQVADPRVGPLLFEWMEALLPSFLWTLKAMKEKKAQSTWALGDWNLLDEEVRFEFRDTRMLNDIDLEGIVAHEVLHGVLHMARQVPIGSVIDEQLVNRLSRKLVPGQQRSLSISDAVSRVATAEKRWFDDDEREALLDVMPTLVAKLPSKYRDAVIAFDYEMVDDGNGGERHLSLREAADRLGCHWMTAKRRRDRAYTELRALVQG